MKGVFLVSEDPGLFFRVREILVGMGAAISDQGDVVQFADSAGRLFTLFGTIPAGYEWEWREGPFELGSGDRIPDVSALVACWIECRWEEMLASLLSEIGERLDSACWIIDGNGVVWVAGLVDARRVQL